MAHTLLEGFQGDSWCFCLGVTLGVVSHSANKRVRLRELSLQTHPKSRIRCNQFRHCSHGFWQSTLVLHLHLSTLLVKDQRYTQFKDVLCGICMVVVGVWIIDYRERERGPPFCEGIGHHRNQHHLNISIYYMCVIRRSDHIHIMHIQFNSNEYQKKTCFDIWWYWISQKLLTRSLIVNAFDRVYVITLIIPISVCGMNSQNTHYLVKSQN